MIHKVLNHVRLQLQHRRFWRLSAHSEYSNTEIKYRCLVSKLVMSTVVPSVLCQSLGELQSKQESPVRV